MLRRAVFSARQRELLEKKFQQLKYIGKSERQKLATALGLKDSQVSFQNQIKFMFCLISLNKNLFDIFY